MIFGQWNVSRNDTCHFWLEILKSWYMTPHFLSLLQWILMPYVAIIAPGDKKYSVTLSLWWWPWAECLCQPTVNRQHKTRNKSLLSLATGIEGLLLQHNPVHPYHYHKYLIHTSTIWDFPGGPVVNTLSSQCRKCRFDSWSRNEDLTCCKAQPEKNYKRYSRPSL